MGGPPITIRCDCGEARALRYGASWECESCGRAWNTRQIPEGEYRSFVRGLRRARLEPVAAAVAVAAILIPLAFLVSPGLVFVVPVLLGAIAIFYGPIWKRKMRKRIAARPRWELHPE